MKKQMQKPDTRSTHIQPRRSAVVMPLMEKVQVIVGSEEDIFGECYVQAVNSMGRTVKFNKTAIKYE